MQALHQHTSLHGRTPMGGTVVDGGASFRVWAPRAREVFVVVPATGDHNKPTVRLPLARWDDETWVGFVPGVRHMSAYMFHVIGPERARDKRDPYARELTDNPMWPGCYCLLHAPAEFPWHDQGFRPPAFHDLIVYQFHMGTWFKPEGRNNGAFLDVIDRLEYLQALGVNTIQPLPIVEFPFNFSRGYNGVDYFSPETDYGRPDDALDGYLDRINARLRQKGQTLLFTKKDLSSTTNQFRAMIDLCHLYGIAVLMDVVYNHAGGGFDESSIYFFDEANDQGNNNNSLYFTDRGWAGGLVFAFWNAHVRQFLIDNAVQYLIDCHVDGFRYDEVSVIKNEGGEPGWRFCRDVTDTVRYVKPQAIQIAECWPAEDVIVRPAAEGGAGFDAVQNDGLRIAVRAAIGQASGGENADVDLNRVAQELTNHAVRNRWRAVNSVEDHDIVYDDKDRQWRIAKLADPGNSRSWRATSRSRVATGLVLTAPGIPHIFMGQEILEDKQWHDDPNRPNLIWWEGLWNENAPGHKPMADFLRFTQELIATRRRLPGLRGEGINVFYVHNADRTIAFHRWVPGEGHDVVVVASLREKTLYDYRLGFPRGGFWREAFNSDVYENWVNPSVAGNGGGVEANGAGMHGLPASASITIPANGLLIFAR